MRKYRLIKEYPGSPKLGEIIKPHQNSLYFVEGEPLTETFIKAYPEFSVEVVEKDYEILKIRCTVPSFGGYILTSLQNGKFANDYKQVFFEPEYYEIYQVRRLSDGQIFTAGDSISLFDQNKFFDKIKSFEIVSNTIFVYFKNQISNANISTIHKFKQPLFTTEDGVDIFEGDNYFKVLQESFILLDMKNANDNHRKDATTFSTKEAAEEYILYNKPLLTLKDVEELLCKNTSSYFLEKFKKRAQKLNNKN